MRRLAVVGVLMTGCAGGPAAAPAPAEAAPVADDRDALVADMGEVLKLADEFRGAGPERRAAIEQRAAALEARMVAAAERVLAIGRDHPEFRERQTDLLFALAAERAPEVHARLAARTRPAVDATAWYQVTRLRDALESFRGFVGRYPTTDEGLAILVDGGDHIPPFVDAAMVEDPWGRPFRYEATVEGYRLASDGPDGRPDTDDDLVARSPLEDEGR